MPIVTTIERLFPALRFDMHTRSLCRLSGIALALIVICTSAASDAAEQTALPGVGPIDEASPFITKANKEWEAAIQAGDADALSRPYHEDGVFVGPDGAAVRGRAAIRAMYAGRTTSKSRIVAATIRSEGRVAAGEDEVYEWGSGWMLVQSADGTQAKRGGRYLTVWHRQPDGTWLITRNLAL
jgi:uncharacterized protein (TIGR02246 family)